MNREIDTPGNQCWDVVVYLVYREDQALDEENPLAWCRLAFKNPQKEYTVIGSENEDVPLGLEPSTFYEDDERDPRDILKNDGLGNNFRMFPFVVLKEWKSKALDVYSELIRQWEDTTTRRFWVKRVLDWMLKEGYITQAEIEEIIRRRRSCENSPLPELE
jgi:hypothetical protein